MISHYYHESGAVCRLWPPTKNLPGNKLELAAGWGEIEMSNSRLIRPVVCAFVAIVYNRVHIVGQVWLISLASHGGIHDWFNGCPTSLG